MPLRAKALWLSFVYCLLLVMLDHETPVKERTAKRKLTLQLGSPRERPTSQLKLTVKLTTSFQNAPLPSRWTANPHQKFSSKPCS